MAISGSSTKNMRTGARIWISPELDEAGRMDVKIRSARNNSRKRICEILRNCGNLEWATNVPNELTGDYASGVCAGSCCATWPSHRTGERTTQESFAPEVLSDSDSHHLERLQSLPFEDHVGEIRGK